MLLVVDIGNTNIKMALFKGKRIVHIWRIATEKNKSYKQYKKSLKKLFCQKKVKSTQIDEVIICSVVPKFTTIFKKVLFSLFKKRPQVLGKDIIAPIKNLYKRPGQVGQDRLANAVAAFQKYGGPIIVVDFGTAVTFDVVSRAGSYLGGIIVPGMELAQNALSENADLLPKIKLGRPRAFLGRDTVSSIKSGMVYGYSFLVEGIIQNLKKELGPHLQVIATGGKAPLMFAYCRSINKLCKHLTLEGLRLVGQKKK